MSAQKKLVHTLLIISELLMIAAHIIVCVMYGKFTSASWNEKIWMGSKIKTIEKIMRENNNNIYPILGIETNSNTSYNKNYKYLLEHSSKSECKENYKKCGTLDSTGNIMCIPNEDKCPINNLKVLSRYNHSYLLSSGYNITYPQALSSTNEALYCSNNANDQAIVTKIIFGDETQLYINPDNFVFDRSKYQDYQDSLKPSSTSKFFNWFNRWTNWKTNLRDKLIDIPIRIIFHKMVEVGEGPRKLDEKLLYGDAEVTNYIFDKFLEKNNLDTTYRNISDKVRAKYYLGFQDIDSLNKFTDKDFYNFYFVRYPNVASFVFTIILFVLFLGYVIFSLTRICDDKEEFDDSFVSCGKVFLILPYAAFFLGFFIYFLVKYTEIYKKKRAEELLNIRADPFIEDFIKEITAQIPKGSLTIAIFILYSISLFIFVLAWFLIHRFTQKSSELMESLGK